VPACPSGVLLLTGSQADYVLITPAEEREGSGRGAAGWLPRPAGSPGPNTALMRAGGADGHTQGARDYCPGPKRVREGDLRRRQQQGLLKLTCSPAVERVLNVTLMDFCKDGLGRFG